MGGDSNCVDVLNNTLLFIIKMLNKHDIQNWFVGYGTLLGIVRENSCINGDDDVDIIMHIDNYDIILKLLIDNDFEICYYGIGDSKHIIKTNPRIGYCSIDFYMANIDATGNFRDTWENVLWSKCYNNDKQLIEYNWNNEKLYLPHNYTHIVVVVKLAVNKFVITAYPIVQER